MKCINFYLISAELKMDVLREREVKDSLERQLSEEQKLRGKKFIKIKNQQLSNLICHVLFVEHAANQFYSVNVNERKSESERKL
jgi:hypothetical protein